MPLLLILRRLCAEEIIKNHQKLSKSPKDTKITSNTHQSTNMYRKYDFLVILCIGYEAFNTFSVIHFTASLWQGG